MDHYPDHRGRGHPLKYPVKHMAVGDSVVFTGVNAQKVGNAVRHYKLLTFRCRTVIAGGVPSCRVTRVA